MPITSATTTKASQPKIAFLRCWALQRPMRWARFCGGPGGGAPLPSCDVAQAVLSSGLEGCHPTVHLPSYPMDSPAIG